MAETQPAGRVRVSCWSSPFFALPGKRMEPSGSRTGSDFEDALPFGSRLNGVAGGVCHPAGLRVRKSFVDLHQSENAGACASSVRCLDDVAISVSICFWSLAW